MTPAERTARARRAALTMHAQGKTNTAAARAAFAEKFQTLVDPEGVLSERERLRRAELAMRAHFVKLAQASARARQTPRRR